MLKKLTLVNTLRDSGTSYISLVYEENKELLGHILFTPVELIGEPSNLKLMGLAHMAVTPSLQNKGIGSSLIKAGVLKEAQGTIKYHEAFGRV